MPQPLLGTPRSSRSARAKAQRPQLVPRASGVEAEADPDVAQVNERTPDVPEGWGAALSPTPAPALEQEQPKFAPTAAPTLTLTPISIYDIDRLWDWCREDPQGTQRFLGFAPDHSRALQDYIGKLLTLEQKGFAALRTIMAEGHAIGIITLMPVSRDVPEPYGDAHCYLMPALHGHLPQLLPSILAEAARLEPTLTLRVSTHDYAFARLLQPHGFTLSIVLTRPASATQKR